MKNIIPGILLAGASLPALAHEGHGVDAGSLFHFFSSPHLLVPLSLGICVAAALYLGIKHYR